MFLEKEDSACNSRIQESSNFSSIWMSLTIVVIKNGY